MTKRQVNDESDIYIYHNGCTSTRQDKVQLLELLAMSACLEIILEREEGKEERKNSARSARLSSFGAEPEHRTEVDRVRSSQIESRSIAIQNGECRVIKADRTRWSEDGLGCDWV